MPLTGAEIIEIDDMGEVEQPDSDTDTDFTSTKEISKPQVIGVPQLDTYKACLRCKAHVEPLTPLGRCSRPECSVMQRYDKSTSHLSTKLLITWSDTLCTGPRTLILHALGRIVYDIAGVDSDDTVSTEDLLQAPPMSSLTYNKKNVITGFSRL